MKWIKPALLTLNLLLVPLLIMDIPSRPLQADCKCEKGSIQKEIVDTYVEVEAPGKVTGAGVLLDLNGEYLVLTCAHMVEDMAGEDDKIMTYRPLTVRKKSEDTDKQYESPADVVQVGNSDNGVDLALIRPRKHLCPKYPAPALWKCKLDLEVGEDVWYIGTPAHIHARLEKSIISLGIRSLPGLDGKFFGINGCVWYGNSGGPVFVLREGHYYLAGIVARADEDMGVNPKATGYAVDHATIRKFLDHYLNPPKKALSW